MKPAAEQGVGTISNALKAWIAGAVALVVAGAAVPANAQGQPATGTARLSVLTYNVEGLPFPLAFGRSAAAGSIAARLKALRASGQQPHVVVLQEAFGKAQRAIGRAAGYKYVVFGPDEKTAPADIAMTAEDRAFAAKASMFKGERSGKWAGSGLAILSDYPIVDVRRAAFPAFACAGYDCLANKGVMLAMVEVPGVERPVAVIATHLNSKDASGVTKPRWNYAFQRQVDTIGGFLHANLASDTPYVFAGDTNIGKSIPRRAQFEAMLTGLPRAIGGIIHTALSTCLGAGGGCALSAPRDVQKAFTHGKDWQVYAGGLDTTLRPIAIGVPFGRDAAGHMLSDHIGYTALYELATLVRRAPTSAGSTLIALR